MYGKMLSRTSRCKGARRAAAPTSGVSQVRVSLQKKGKRKREVMIITLINNTIIKTKSKRNWTINKDRYLQYVSRRVPTSSPGRYTTTRSQTRGTLHICLSIQSRHHRLVSRNFGLVRITRRSSRHLLLPPRSNALVRISHSSFMFASFARRISRNSSRMACMACCISR